MENHKVNKYEIINVMNLKINLASPNDNDDYAHLLYESLRSADRQGLKKVFAVQPDNQGVGTAINDRPTKAANN